MPTYKNNSSVPLKLHNPTGSTTVAPGGTIDVASLNPPRGQDREGFLIRLERVSDEAVKKAAPVTPPKETKKKEVKPTKKRRWGK